MTKSDRDLFEQRINASLDAIGSLRQRTADLRAITDTIVAALKSGGTVYTAGNGGSAAEAMHLAEELIGRYRGNRKPLPAVCLNADATALTCIANDFGFDAVFARQCEALVTKDDVLVLFSTSGNSANVVNAAHIALEKGAAVIGLLGRDGGKCASLCTHALIVPADDPAHIQEAHQVALHLICEVVEHSFHE